jgi:hypothetical protein
MYTLISQARIWADLWLIHLSPMQDLFSALVRLDLPSDIRRVKLHSVFQEPYGGRKRIIDLMQANHRPPCLSVQFIVNGGRLIYTSRCNPRNGVGSTVTVELESPSEFLDRTVLETCLHVSFLIWIASDGLLLLPPVQPLPP